MRSFLGFVRALCPAVSLTPCLLVAMLALAPNVAQALSFNLFDHGFGLLGPHYGLRLDTTGEVYSVEDDAGNSQVILDWVPDSGTASITGNLRPVDPATNARLGADVAVVYDLSGVTSILSGSALIGFEATAGAGMAGTTPLVGKADGEGVVFRFLADGHAKPDDLNTIVGRGWLVGEVGFDDWLVMTPDAIPEPTTALLFGLGLVALGGAHSRRRTNRAR